MYGIDEEEDNKSKDVNDGKKPEEKMLRRINNELVTIKDLEELTEIYTSFLTKSSRKQIKLLE